MQGTQETSVRSLDWEHRLKQEMTTYSSMLAWEIPWTDELGGLQSMGSQRVKHDWVRAYKHGSQKPKKGWQTGLLLEVLGENPFTCVFHFVEIESIRCLMVHFTLISASSFTLSPKLSPMTLIMLFHYCTLLKGPSWLHRNHSEYPEQ